MIVGTKQRQKSVKPAMSKAYQKKRFVSWLTKHQFHWYFEFIRIWHPVDIKKIYLLLRIYHYFFGISKGTELATIYIYDVDVDTGVSRREKHPKNRTVAEPDIYLKHFQVHWSNVHHNENAAHVNMFYSRKMEKKIMMENSLHVQYCKSVGGTVHHLQYTSTYLSM